jgi:ABC-type multidrug transport system ATPase subunit/pSer/pThr/pTyr-binding forkhead associated (FHA) protein
MEFVIGRSPNCELVVNHACVSSRHASVARDAHGGVRITDEGSSNGTFINQPANEIHEAELREHDIIFFSEEYKVPGSLLLKKFLAWEASGGQARGALALGQVNRFTQETITIGSDPANLVALPYLDVWPQHAVIARNPEGGYVLHDLGGGSTVNGTRLAGGALALSPNAAIDIGGVTVSTSFDPARGVITVGAERRGFYLTAKDVTFSIAQPGGTRRLLDRVSFSVLPGEFVGLLGPSGSGKTTLLTCLCGINQASGVFYNGHARAAAAAACANVIGYVPQDDVLYPELTVRETLFYSARLRLHARTSDARIRAKIDEVCTMLGLLDASAGVDLRDTQIGSPERKTLSGGQKKRVNLALELLTDPLVLLLDEPTSGLSSGDTRVVMECLRQLADANGIPIIITIHQPSLRVYELLDQAVYLKAGRLAWFGPAYPDSVRHFVGDGRDSAGADEIMEALDDADAEALRTRYEASRYGDRFVRQREGLIAALTQGGDLVTPKPVRPLHLPGQTLVLLRRQLTRRWRDPVSLAIQLGQAPLLGLMLGAAFHGDRLNSPLFLLSFIAIWFGANATARELVSERVLCKREKRGGVSPAATLWAKLVSHGLILLGQCTLLLLSAHAVLHFEMDLWQGVLSLWLCGLCGATMGFVISALAKTEIAATAATPLVLIPLILFGGYLTPYDRMPAPIQMVSQCMPSRWGYEALVQAEKLRHDSERDGSQVFLEFYTQHGSLYADERRQRIALSLGILAAGSAALACATWILLRRAN